MKVCGMRKKCDHMCTIMLYGMNCANGKSCAEGSEKPGAKKKIEKKFWSSLFDPKNFLVPPFNLAH